MKKDYDLNRPVDDKGNVDGNKIPNFDEKSLMRRKSRLERFFFDAGIPIRIIGDPNKPAIIACDAICLSAYVSNFNLHFTDKAFDGKIIYTVKLHNDVKPDIDVLYDVLIKSEHRQIYRIQYDNTDLYLAGYNFKDKSRSEGKYPVFAKEGSKIYFSDEYALKIISEFKGAYNLVSTRKLIDLDQLYKSAKNVKRKIYR